MKLSLKKNSIFIMLVLLCCAGNLNAQSTSVYKLGQSVENFSLFDINSVKFATKNVKTKKIIVLAFISNECKYSENVNTSIKYIHEKYKNDVEIWAVNSFNPNVKPAESEDKMREYVMANNFKLPYLVDLGKITADMFSVKQVPSAIILVRENDQFKYVYNGSIIDIMNGKQYNILEQNIDNILAGKKVLSAKSKNKVCQIE